MVLFLFLFLLGWLVSRYESKAVEGSGAGIHIVERMMLAFVVMAWAGCHDARADGLF